MGLVGSGRGSHQARLAGAVMGHSPAARTPAMTRDDQGAAVRRCEAVHLATSLGPGVPVAGRPNGDVLDQPRYPDRAATAVGPDIRAASGNSRTSRRVVFPIVDKVGELIGIQGRKIAAGEHGEKMLTNGHGGICAAKLWWRLTRVHGMVTSRSQPSRNQLVRKSRLGLAKLNPPELLCKLF
jgi:hypothetical protein